MFCPNCGATNQDGAKFCQSCGTTLITSQYQHPDAPQTNTYNTTNVKSPLLRSTNPAINLLKTVAASPMFLTLVIAYSVAVLFNIISSLNVINSLDSYLYFLRSALGTSMYLEILDSIESTTVGYTFIGSIPSIVTAAGLWMIYVAGTDTRSGNMKTTGFTIVRVMTIISLVLMIISAVLVGLAFIIIFGAIEDTGRYYTGYSSISAIITVCFLLIGCIFTMTIIYLVKLLKTIGTVINTASRGIPGDSISGYVGGCCYVLGAFQILGLFSAYNFLSAIPGIGFSVFYICLGMLLFDYRKKMRDLMYPQQNYYQTTRHL